MSGRILREQILDAPMGFSKKYNLFYDDNSSKTTLLECYKNYGPIDFKDTDIVLQVGANIGGIIPYIKNVEEVIFVESDPRNIEVLRRNVTLNEVHHATVLHKAVFTESNKELQVFRRYDQYGSASSSIIKRGNRKALGEPVTSVSFEALVNKYKPNFVIVDIEGAEHDLMNQITDQAFDTFFIEIHMTRKKWSNKTVEWMMILEDIYEEIQVTPHVYFGKVICNQLTCYKNAKNT